MAQGYIFSHGVRLVVAFALGAGQLAFAEPHITQSQVIGPLTGHDAKLDPENLKAPKVKWYGTDLGFTYEHRGHIVFLFGDSWATEAYSPIQGSTQGKWDDSWGTVNLAQWPDPAKISPSNIPTVRLARNPGTDEVAAMNPGVALDLDKTPLHGFSNGTEEFGLFLTTKPQGCRIDSDCGPDLKCDAGLGFYGVSYTEETKGTNPCLDGTPGCQADTMQDKSGKPLPGSGFCVDPKAHRGTPTAWTRLNGVAQQIRIGVRSHRDPRLYENAQVWLTNKFYNATVRTVQRFSPGNPGADFSTAKGTGDAQRVFVWGRPGFVGVRAKGQPLDLYFGYTDLPTSHDFKWQMHYYTGLKDGQPQFSTAERDAAPVVLDETHDVVNQMSMSWIAPLHKWVMFYGGGSSSLPLPPLSDCGVLQLFAGSDCKSVNMDNGAVFMRTADNPWGPWSAPQDVLVGGDVSKPNEQHGPGGLLFHALCQEKSCATGTHGAFYRPNEYGFFYAANIIESWTRPVAGGGVDVLWNVSTWDPYRVALVRTRIMP
jgi:hypothetical protein